jgi:fatty-acyl-CoA synthase
MGFFQNIKDDITFLRGAWRALRLTTPIARNPTRVFPGVIEELAERFGDAPALISDREQLSYHGLAERSNRYARWALSQNVAKGDTVCLLMPNRPEYMAIWIGITRIGGVVSLLNTNLVGPSLAHCIDIVQPRLIIVSSELAQTLASATPFLNSKAEVWSYGNGTNFPRIDAAVSGLSGAPLSASERRPLHIDDRALYIYTSGTTGLPKAANLNHYRIMLAAHGARPHVRLPAHVPYHRRHCRHRRPAAQRRLGVRAREILRARFLGRCGPP